VNRSDVTDRFSNVSVNQPPALDTSHDRGESIIHQDNRRRFTGNVRTPGSHRDPDIRCTETGSIVHPIARHADDFSIGLQFSDGPLNGLLSRAVVVIDEKGNVKYTEQVPEITQEPNYDGAMNALKN
jgi:hypothetical protein